MPGPTAPAISSHILATNAQHKRELADLQKKYQALDRQFAATNAKVRSGRNSVRVHS